MPRSRPLSGFLDAVPFLASCGSILSGHGTESDTMLVQLGKEVVLALGKCLDGIPGSGRVSDGVLGQGELNDQPPCAALCVLRRRTLSGCGRLFPALLFTLLYGHATKVNDGAVSGQPSLPASKARWP